jgi:hypothetical protein
MTKPIETQQELTTDARDRNYKPGAVVHTVIGAEVQIVSWPWYEGEGEDRSARVMVRTTPGDCRTITEVPYFAMVGPVLREEALDS